MKNSLKMLTVSVLSLLILPHLSSCGGSGADDNTLRILVKDADFGSEWIEKIADDFIADHPDIKVEITAQYDINSLIDYNLNSKNNQDDLYISVGDRWKSYAASGKLASLDDLIEEEVDGVKVKDKVSEEFQSSIYFTRANGDVHSYRLPWTSGVGGIFYNKKMFAENGWEVPTTFEELLALCETINAARVPVSSDPNETDAVKPFAYTGSNTDYFDYTVFSWWAQIVGKDAINEFLKYESADIFDVSKNPTYAGLKTATEYWNQLFTSENYIAGSQSKDAATAQKEFLNGYSAMMLNGDWLYNAILNYGSSSSSQFELGIMKTPVVAEANPEYVNSTFVTGEDQFIAIPASSKHQDLAKEFIKYIISDDGCKTFLSEANGFLAYDCSYEDLNLSEGFIRDMIDLRETYTDKFTSFSSSRIYLCNTINIWSSSANRPYLNLLNNSTTIDRSFQTIASYASASWADWLNNTR